MDELERRLRRALAGTTEEAPRPLAPLELPLGLDRLLAPLMLRRLGPASVLVPVLRRDEGLRVLFTQRSDKLRKHRGQISFPGGRREPEDASAAAAALREAHEEVGLPRESVEVVGYLDDYPTTTGFLVTPVVGIVHGQPEVHPCAHEVAAVFEVPLDFLLDTGNFARLSFRRNGMKVPIFELNHGAWRIWGATAGMLMNLAQKVAAAPA